MLLKFRVAGYLGRKWYFSLYVGGFGDFPLVFIAFWNHPDFYMGFYSIFGNHPGFILIFLEIILVSD